MPDSPEFLVVGRTGKPHGIKGEVTVLSLTDRPDWVFRADFKLLAVPTGQGTPSPDSRVLPIAAARPFRRGYIVGFKGIEDRNQAAGLANHQLFVPVDNLAPLERDEYFHHQIVGLAVTELDGTEVGTVGDILTVGPTTLLEVTGGAGTCLVPFRQEFIAELNLDEGHLVIDPPPGLIDH